MRKTLKKVLIAILSFFLTVMLVLAFGLFWVFENPKEAWELVEERILPKDMKVTWQDMDIEFQHLKRFDFRFDWTVQGLRIQKQKPELDVPLDRLRIHSSILVSSEKQKVILHDGFLLAAKEIVFRPEPSRKDKDPKNLFQMVQENLKHLNTFQKWAKVENLDITISQLDFGKNPILVSLDAHQSMQNEISDLLAFRAQVKREGESDFSVATDGKFRLSLLNSEDSFIEGQVRFKGFGVETEQKFNANYMNEQAGLQTRGLVTYQAPRFKLIVKPDLNLHLKETEGRLALKADVDGLPGPLVKVDNFQLHITTPFEKNIFLSEKASDFQMSAPIGLFFIDPDMRKPIEKSCQCRIPEVLLAEAKGQAWLAHLTSQPKEQVPVLKTALTLESVKNKLLSVDFAANLQVDKKMQEWFFQPRLQTSAVVHNFQGLREFLDAKHILIPAPFDVLQGSISLQANGPIESTKESYTFPIRLNTDLASENQLVRLESEAAFRLARNFKEGFAHIKARIQDFQVVLPPLDPLKGKPRVTLDRRILRAPKVKKKKSEFKMAFAVEVETARPGAVRLLADYFKPLMPLTLQVQYAPGTGNSGFLQTEPFQVEYLRRTVHVEKMRIDLSQSKAGVLPVDGRFRINQAEYKIFIEVKGTTAKPNIEMSSEPYLPESEIISVLLYGRTSEQLVGADAETAGSVQAAVADRAIGLFGLWAFASTPIQSFSYNPVTKVYSATVALGDDVTAGIGTNWEAATNVELRKRVTQNWILTAIWTPATQDEEQATKLVLQWERRF